MVSDFPNSVSDSAVLVSDSAAVVSGFAVLVSIFVVDRLGSPSTRKPLNAKTQVEGFSGVG